MGKDAVGFSVPDDVLTKHANLARLGMAAATVAGGVGTYNGLHSLASRMQPTYLPHNPEFAQAGPPNPHTEESFPA